MFDLTIHHLRFTCTALSPIALGANKGAAFRGALIGALRKHYCPNAAVTRFAPDAGGEAMHAALCPVCWLIAAEDEEAQRGKDAPRAYTIQPPLARKTVWQTGESFAWGVTLFGRALNLFPYIVLAVPQMGAEGIGAMNPRGRFMCEQIEAVNPLLRERRTLLALRHTQNADGPMVRVPDLPVTAAQVDAEATRLAAALVARDNRLTLRFLTPTRIVDRGRLMHTPQFGPLFQRLCERLKSLGRFQISLRQSTEASTSNCKFQIENPPIANLLASADAVELVADGTRWEDAHSRSARTGQRTPIGGFVGAATYRAADWGPLLPALLWGQSAQVGKSAVKGDGWYEINFRQQSGALAL